MFLDNTNKIHDGGSMNASDLRSTLSEIGLSQIDLARLVDVTPRAVSLWLAAQREIPGPVAAYLRLMLSLPVAQRALELARLKENKAMIADGLYRVDYQGHAGGGYGIMALTQGNVAGIDEGGVEYDGTFAPAPASGMVDAQLHLTVPPGVALVQGVPPRAMKYGFDMEVRFAIRGKTQLTVQTPFGPVQAVITHLRTLPN